MGELYNQLLAVGELPPTLTHLTFGVGYNQPLAVDELPPTLTHLTFGRNFNRPLAGVLPPTLTHLTFGETFDQPLTRVLPRTVEEVTLGSDFKQTVCFPPSLRTLRLPENPARLAKKLSGSPSTTVYFGKRRSLSTLRPPPARKRRGDSSPNTAAAVRRTEWYQGLPRGHRVGNVTKSSATLEALRDALAEETLGGSVEGAAGDPAAITAYRARRAEIAGAALAGLVYNWLGSED